MHEMKCTDRAIPISSDDEFYRHFNACNRMVLCIRVTHRQASYNSSVRGEREHYLAVHSIFDQVDPTHSDYRPPTTNDNHDDDELL